MSRKITRKRVSGNNRTNTRASTKRAPSRRKTSKRASSRRKTSRRKTSKRASTRRALLKKKVTKNKRIQKGKNGTKKKLFGGAMRQESRKAVRHQPYAHTRPTVNWTQNQQISYNKVLHTLVSDQGASLLPNLITYYPENTKKNTPETFDVEMRQIVYTLKKINVFYDILNSINSMAGRKIVLIDGENTFRQKVDHETGRPMPHDLKEILKQHLYEEGNNLIIIFTHIGTLIAQAVNRVLVAGVSGAQALSLRYEVMGNKNTCKYVIDQYNNLTVHIPLGQAGELDDIGLVYLFFLIKYYNHNPIKTVTEDNYRWMLEPAKHSGIPAPRERPFFGYNPNIVTTAYPRPGALSPLKPVSAVSKFEERIWPTEPLEPL
jgi:hypothetical protein